MKEILIKSKRHGNKVILVDDEDFDGLNKHLWGIHKSRWTFYALRNNDQKNKLKPKSILMHRVIMNCIFSKENIDHIDGNGLNNQKSNLRICNIRQNNCNARVRKNKTSKYKGVWPRDKTKTKWRASISIFGYKINLGSYNSEEEAAIAYNNAAQKHHKEFAKLNDIV